MLGGGGGHTEGGGGMNFTKMFLRGIPPPPPNYWRDMCYFLGDTVPCPSLISRLVYRDDISTFKDM